MSINFTGISTPTEVVPTNSGATLNLTKNTFLDLTKAAPSLRDVQLCAGWDVAEVGGPFDLDISVFLLNNMGKVANIPNDVVFYNNPNANGIHLNGDNRTGNGDGDDEVIDINLDAVSSAVEKIVCCVTIDKAVERRQTFGMVNHSYVRLVDTDNGNELCRFELKDNNSVDTAVVFAELVRNNGSWNFHTIGEGKNADLNGILAMFM